jgi:Domain of unknown function (DUF5655)/Domain of unknown function (DUF4287)
MPRSKHPKYGVHPSIKMAQSIVANMKPKTGRTLDEWVELVKKKGPAQQKDRNAWLKEKQGLGMVYAHIVAQYAEGKGAADHEPEGYLAAAPGYVDAMYAGPKEALRPIHDRLVELGMKLGRDVRVCPCTTVVPLYRNHVIAEIKPSTRTRIDFGLALRKHKGNLPKRIVETGGLAKDDRITHKIPLTKLDEVDDEVMRWMKVAYELDEK